MFANLTEKLTKALRDLRGLSKLTEDNIAPALVEVRSALMSADVNFKVAKDFTERVKAACLGTAVVDSVNPGQMDGEPRLGCGGELAVALGGIAFPKRQEQGFGGDRGEDADQGKEAGKAHGGGVGAN